MMIPNPFYWQEKEDDLYFEAADAGFDNLEDYAAYLESLEDEMADRECDEMRLE